MKITNDPPQLLHVQPDKELVSLKMFYHELCNLENGKSPSEIHYDSDDDFSEPEDIRFDSDESKLSNADELNQHQADLVKFKTSVEINIVKLKDRINASTPKNFYKHPYRLGFLHSVVSLATLKEITFYDMNYNRCTQRIWGL